MSGLGLDDAFRALLADARDYAVEAIALLGDRGPEDLERDRRTQFAVLYALQTVGEAAYKASADDRALLPDLPWREMVATRHIIVHGYAKTDLDILVNTVRNDLPTLVGRLNEILGEGTTT